MTQAPPPQQQPAVHDMQAVAPLFHARGWLKLLGILAIIGGVFQALTIVGLLIAWLPIWMGVLAFQASKRYEAAAQTGDAAAAEQGSAKLGTVITIMGVLALIGLILNAVVLIFAVAGGGFAAFQMGNS